MRRRSCRANPHRFFRVWGSGFEVQGWGSGIGGAQNLNVPILTAPNRLAPDLTLMRAVMICVPHLVGASLLGAVRLGTSTLTHLVPKLHDQPSIPAT